MKKASLSQFPAGSAELVIAHAVYQRSRGRNPSMPFITEFNPQKALQLANSVVAGANVGRYKATLGTIAMKFHPSFEVMTDLEFEAAVRAIVADSSSPEEIRRRVRSLGYEDEINLLVHVPTDEVGLQAREIVRSLGAPITKDGGMVMMTIHGHHGLISI